MELAEHSVIGHGISVNVGAQPGTFAWTRGRDGWKDRPTNRGHCRILTHGESHPSRWFQTYHEVSLILEPRFLADVVEDGLPADRIAFVTSDSVTDAAIANYAETFRAELAADAPNGLLYAETLTIGLALHLLTNYGVAKPKVIAPRAKLNSFQLRATIEFIESHLADDVPLLALADQAHISPFHFARLFRRTVGLAPHQFVVRLRIQRAIGLLRRAQMPLAQIAVACGFHDQPHFIRAFRNRHRHNSVTIRPANPAEIVTLSIQQVSTRAIVGGAVISGP
jgi:AraC family transcriptional regulator